MKLKKGITKEQKYISYNMYMHVPKFLIIMIFFFFLSIAFIHRLNISFHIHIKISNKIR